MSLNPNPVLADTLTAVIFSNISDIFNTIDLLRVDI
jgi:hypothetical protein